MNKLIPAQRSLASSTMLRLFSLLVVGTLAVSVVDLQTQRDATSTGPPSKRDVVEPVLERMWTQTTALPDDLGLTPKSDTTSTEKDCYIRAKGSGSTRQKESSSTASRTSWSSNENSAVTRQKESSSTVSSTSSSTEKNAAEVEAEAGGTTEDDIERPLEGAHGGRTTKDSIKRPALGGRPPFLSKWALEQHNADMKQKQKSITTAREQALVQLPACSGDHSVDPPNIKLSSSRSSISNGDDFVPFAPFPCWQEGLGSSSGASTTRTRHLENYIGAATADDHDGCHPPSCEKLKAKALRIFDRLGRTRVGQWALGLLRTSRCTGKLAKIVIDACFVAYSVDMEDALTDQEARAICFFGARSLWM
ncbi:unnamed protein product [Amoebophrya sp. A25]|nr:unnamed protein product [Amoebophrya sp. A25]|eukprot:GSA25T00013155001.1